MKIPRASRNDQSFFFYINNNNGSHVSPIENSYPMLRGHYKTTKFERTGKMPQGSLDDKSHFSITSITLLLYFNHLILPQNYIPHIKRTWRNENYKCYLHKTCLLFTLRWGAQAPVSADAPALAKVAAAARASASSFLKAFFSRID